LSTKLKYLILQTIGLWLVRSLLYILRPTVKIVYNDTGLVEEIKNRTDGAIFAFWHCDMIMVGLASYREKIHRKGIYVLASRSRDGELLARVVKTLGIKSVRGSSSRGAVRGLLSLKQKIDQKENVAVAVDGPRGPRFHVKPGVILLAKITGVPIYPVACRVSYKFRFNSWDRTEIPFPFSRCEFNIGEPLYIETTADSEQMQKASDNLEQVLIHLKQEQ